MLCNNCGKEIASDANFCKYCGARIEIGEAVNNEDAKDIIKDEGDMAQKPLNEEAKVIVDNAEEIATAENDDSLNDDSLNKGTKKSKKSFYIIGGLLIAIILAVVVIIGMRPSVESISAKYNGSNDIGTKINENSDITVIATYDNGEQEKVKDGWTIDGGKLEGGDNKYTIKYEEKETDLNISCDLMNNGKFLATRSDIEDRFETNADENISWYRGLTACDDEYSDALGDMKIDGADELEARIFFMKKGGKSVKLGNSEIPNTFGITLVSVNGNEEEYGKWGELGAAALCTVDSSFTFNQARKKIGDFVGKLLKQKGSYVSGRKRMAYEYSQDLDNLNISGTFLLGNSDASLMLRFNDL